MSLRSRLLIDGSLPLAPAIPGWHSQIGQDECLVEHIFKRRRGLYYIDLWQPMTRVTYPTRTSSIATIRGAVFA